MGKDKHRFFRRFPRISQISLVILATLGLLVLTQTFGSRLLSATGLRRSLVFLWGEQWLTTPDYAKELILIYQDGSDVACSRAMIELVRLRQVSCTLLIDATLSPNDRVRSYSIVTLASIEAIAPGALPKMPLSIRLQLDDLVRNGTLADKIAVHGLRWVKDRRQADVSDLEFLAGDPRLGKDEVDLLLILSSDMRDASLGFLKILERSPKVAALGLSPIVSDHLDFANKGIWR